MDWGWGWGNVPSFNRWLFLQTYGNLLGIGIVGALSGLSEVSGGVGPGLLGGHAKQLGVHEAELGDGA